MSTQQHPARGRRSSSPTAQATQVRAFSISEVNLDAGYREVRVEGELDLSVAERFRQRLEAAVSDDVDVLVCLERCDFIDSTGIAAVVFAHQQLTGRGRRLVLCSPSRQVSRILTVTGLNHVGLVYASTEEALAEGFGQLARRPDEAEVKGVGR